MSHGSPAPGAGHHVHVAVRGPIQRPSQCGGGRAAQVEGGRFTQGGLIGLAMLRFGRARLTWALTGQLGRSEYRSRNAPPVAGVAICAGQDVRRRPGLSAMDPCRRAGWRSPWRSAAGPLNRQRGRGLAGTRRHAGGGIASGSDRHRIPVRRHEHTQVTWLLPMGKRRHRLRCACWGHGRWRSCRAARKGSLGAGAAGPLATGALTASRVH
jgi:hypothetical protein